MRGTWFGNRSEPEKMGVARRGLNGVRTHDGLNPVAIQEQLSLYPGNRHQQPWRHDLDRRWLRSRGLVREGIVGRAKPGTPADSFPHV